MVQPGWTNNLEEFFEYEETIGVFVVICVVVIFLAVCTVLFFVGLASIDDDDDDDTNTVKCTVDNGTCDAATGVCTCNASAACSATEFECTSGIIQCGADGLNCTCNNDPVIVECDGGNIIDCGADGLNCTCYTAPIDTEPIDPDLVLWFPMNTKDAILQKGSDPDTYGRQLSISTNAAIYDETHVAWKFNGTSYLYDLGGDPDDDKSTVNVYKAVCEGMRKAYTINIWASLDISLIKNGETMAFFALGSHSGGYTKNSIGLYRKDNNTVQIQNGWYGCGYYSTISLSSGDKSFHMYTCVYDDYDDIRSIYFDGELVSSAVTNCVPIFEVLTAGTTEVDALRNGLTIGTSGDSSYLTGELSDLRLYSKALNGAAVNDIYIQQ